MPAQMRNRDIKEDNFEDLLTSSSILHEPIDFEINIYFKNVFDCIQRKINMLSFVLYGI